LRKAQSFATGVQKKDNAHYGMISTAETEEAAMIAWAQRLITSRECRARLIRRRSRWSAPVSLDEPALVQGWGVRVAPGRRSRSG
jgi:hypothetical protein